MLAGYGEINVNAALPAQVGVTNAAPVPVTGWQVNGPQGAGDMSVLPDQANSRIKVETGNYLVQAHLTLTVGANGAGDLTFQILKNGAVADGKLTCRVTAGAAAARAHIDISGILNIAQGDTSPQQVPNAPSWDPRFPTSVNQALIQLGVQSSVVGGIGFVVEAGTLALYRIGA